MPHGPSIAILCPGPSLAGFLAHPPLHDAYIGVNRAATAWVCSWWAFADHESFNLFTPLGRPTIFTADQAARLAAREYPDRWAHATVLRESDIGTRCPSDPGWKHYSMHIALVLAQHLGAREIVAYGADMEGVTDWDGAVRGARTPYRWANERHKLDHIVAWLASEGVEFRREVGLGVPA
jgi:hypothetical protein